MGLSFNVEALFAYLQQLPSFRCIDLQCVEEDNHLYIRATVGSAGDRTRLLAALAATLDGISCTHMIQIDPLLNTPFSPTLPFQEGEERPRDIFSQPFLRGGEYLAAATVEKQ